MKKIIQYSVFIILIGCISFVSCKKEKSATSINPPPPPPPQPTGKTVKVRVVEFGTEIPIADASVSVCTSPVSFSTCAGSNTLVTTNNNGEAFFIANRYLFYSVVKAGYFEDSFLGLPCFVQYLGPDSAGGAHQAIHTADSLVVKIVPKTDFTLHITDSSLRGPLVGTYLTADVNFNTCGIGGLLGTNLRKGIDTTILFHTYYGNAAYLFTVGYEPDDGGFPQNILYHQQRFVSAGNNTIINITY